MPDDASERRNHAPTGADTPEETHGSTTEEARSWARDRRKDVRHASREAAREFRMRAQERTDRWTSSLGEEVTSIAHAVRDAGDTFDKEGKPQIADWARAGAGGAERLAGYLRDEDPREMLNDLTDFARSNPALFAGTTFVGGLLLGRFLRSSEPGDDVRGPTTGSGRKAQQYPAEEGPSHRTEEHPRHTKKEDR